jgi:hypothetical protein
MIAASHPGRPRFRLWRISRLSLIVTAVVTVPAMVMYSGLATSLALGTLLCAVWALTLAKFLKQPVSVSPRWKDYAVGVVGIILLHVAVASLLVRVEFGRAIASTVLLLLMFIASRSAARVMLATRERLFERGIRASLILFLVIGVAGALHLFQFGSGRYLKSVFPFTEPSHFAMTLGPFLLYVAVTEKPRWRLAWVAPFLAIAGALQNLTLIVLCALVAVTSLSRRQLLAILAAAALVALNLNLSYYMQRVMLSSESHNISALAYLQGWELIAEAWRRTLDWGYGFQQLGVIASNTAAVNALAAIGAENGNKFDGGFTLSKILCEFGLLGVAICVAYFKLAIRALRLLRSNAVGATFSSRHEVFAGSCITTYLIELLVRGGGYFTPGGFLLLASLWIWFGAQATVHRDVSRLRRWTLFSRRGPAPGSIR